MLARIFSTFLACCLIVSLSYPAAHGHTWLQQDTLLAEQGLPDGVQDILLGYVNLPDLSLEQLTCSRSLENRIVSDRRTVCKSLDGHYTMLKNGEIYNPTSLTIVDSFSRRPLLELKLTSHTQQEPNLYCTGAQIITSLNPNIAPLVALAITDKNQKNPVIYLWSLKTQQLLHVLKVPVPSLLRTLCNKLNISENGRFVAYYDDPSMSLFRWDLERANNAPQRYHLPLISLRKDDRAQVLKVLPDGDVLFIGTQTAMDKTESYYLYTCKKTSSYPTKWEFQSVHDQKSLAELALVLQFWGHDGSNFKPETHRFSIERLNKSFSEIQVKYPELATTLIPLVDRCKELARVRTLQYLWEDQQKIYVRLNPQNPWLQRNKMALTALFETREELDKLNSQTPLPLTEPVRELLIDAPEYIRQFLITKLNIPYNNSAPVKIIQVAPVKITSANKSTSKNKVLHYLIGSTLSVVAYYKLIHPTRLGKTISEWVWQPIGRGLLDLLKALGSETTPYRTTSTYYPRYHRVRI